MVRGDLLDDFYNILPLDIINVTYTMNMNY